MLNFQISTHKKKFILYHLALPSATLKVVYRGKLLAVVLGQRFSSFSELHQVKRKKYANRWLAT
jgi:hypothetical protein